MSEICPYCGEEGPGLSEPNHRMICMECYEKSPKALWNSELQPASDKDFELYELRAGVQSIIDEFERVSAGIDELAPKWDDQSMTEDEFVRWKEYTDRYGLLSNILYSDFVVEMDKDFNIIDERFKTEEEE